MEAVKVEREKMLEAQAAIIGALCIDGDKVAGMVFSRTRPEHYEGPYREAFEIAQKLKRDGKPIDAVTIGSALGLEAYKSWILELMDMTPTAANTSAYIDLLLENYKISKLQSIGLKLAGCRTMEPEEIQTLLSEAHLLTVRKDRGRIVSLSDGMMGFWERQQQKPEYIPWGIPKISQAIYSERGDFVVIGGYASSGKTALSLQMAWEQAEKYKVGYFSYETSAAKIYDRIGTMAACLDFGRVKRRELTEKEYDLFYRTGKEFDRRSLKVIEASGMTTAEIESVSQAEGFEIIYIDYLQLIDKSGKAEYDRVSQISKELHTMATRLGILVVALSQLSRPDKSDRGEKAPTIHSLLSSSQIGNDADAILLLYRADQNDYRRRLKIEKNKEGRSGGYLDLDFIGSMQRFREIEDDDE